MGGPFGLSGGIFFFLLVVEYFSDEYDPNTLSASGMSLEGERVGGIGTPKIGLCRGGRGFFFGVLRSGDGCTRGFFFS